MSQEKKQWHEIQYPTASFPKGPFAETDALQLRHSKWISYTVRHRDSSWYEINLPMFINLVDNKYFMSYFLGI